MSCTETNNYLCACDFEVEDDGFNWKEDGAPFSAWFPERAAEAFVEWRARFDGLDPNACRVVVLDRKTEETTRWNVDVDITYTALPVEE